ncbi:MAG: serine/threonine protein kinase, partial [Verrucomicrobiae bacterium]|nr:serine/threonine protein kinase [Verrucomicrobiae bacterium]
MAPESSREREICLEALECPSTTACGRYLDSACGEDLALRQLVESLLECHRSQADTPAPPFPMEEGIPGAVNYPLGTFIERYRLVRQIGGGGCGVVYLAEQEAPIRRQVALKVLKPGMDSQGVIARFEIERQTLALMDHTNIARLIDAGATPAGHPYFVMEWVRGEPLTEYCDTRRLSISLRIELFLQVCRAVEHAHQKGIIHRDLKPSNILVVEQDGRPVPKVIDFGIAQAIQSAGDSRSPSHPSAGFVGTPAYMSPEQLRGGRWDARADVYSLGVILFELLTGATPGAFPKASRSDPPSPAPQDEFEALVPSARLKAMPPAQLDARARRMGTRRFRVLRKVPGDLDLITQRALAPVPEHRYASVGDLACDLRFLLAHQPVSARPDSASYRAAKFFRRHRLGVGAALALAVTGGLFAWQYIETDRALERVERAGREMASVQAAVALQQAYRADIHLAQAALEANNLGRALSLLRPYRAGSGSNDLRNWEWRYLWHQCRNDAIQTLGSLSNEVVRMAVSKDGRWVAAKAQTGLVKVWDRVGGGAPETIDATPDDAVLAIGTASDGVLLAKSWSDTDDPGKHRHGIEIRALGHPGTPARLLPCEAPVLGIWFSRHARTLLSVDRGGIVTHWNLGADAAKPRFSLDFPQHFPPAVAVSDDVSLLAQSLPGGQFRVVETATGRERFRGRFPAAALHLLQFSPDGRRLVVGGGILDTELALWNVDSGEESGILKGHSAWIGGATFLPDGRTVVTASADQTLRLWDAKTGEQTGILRGHEIEVWSVAVSADGHYLASGSKDGVVNVWDLRKSLRNPDPWISEESVQAWRFPSHDRILLTVSPEGSVRRRRLDRLDAPEEILNLGSKAPAPVLSDDGRRLAVETPDCAVAVWNLEQPGGRPETLPIPKPALPVAFMGNGKDLVTWHREEARFRVWDETGKSCRMEWAGRKSGSPGGFGPVAVAGDRIVTLDPSGGPWVRNLESGGIRGYPPSGLFVSGIALSSNGRLVALSSRDGATRLWRFESPRDPVDIGGFLLGTLGVAFSPDASRLAVTSSGQEAVKLFSSS